MRTSPMAALAVALLATVAMTVAAQSSFTTDQCVVQTPDLSPQVQRPIIDVSATRSDADRTLVVSLLATGAKAGAIRAHFSSQNGVIQLVVTDWVLTEEGDNYYTYRLTKVMTPLDPSGTYKLDTLVYTDVTGAETLLNDRPDVDFFVTGTARNVADLPPPAVTSFQFKEQVSQVDARFTSQPFGFTFQVDVAAGTRLGRFSVSYRCPAMPDEVLTFTTTDAVLAPNSGAAAGRVRYNGVIDTAIHPGTFRCIYQLYFPAASDAASFASVVVSDSSLQSLRYPTRVSTAAPFSGANRLDIVSFSDNTPPLSAVVRAYPAFLNSTDADTLFTVNFTVQDGGNGGSTPSGISTIQFAGTFPAGVVTLTRDRNWLRDVGSYEMWSYTVHVPRGFPSATWTFTTPLTITDLAHNVATFQTAGNGVSVSVVCGTPKVHHIDERDLGDSSLNGIVAMLMILTVAFVIGCFWLVRRQRAKYEFDPNADIPAVPGSKAADYHQTEIEIGADASEKPAAAAAAEAEREHRPVAFAAHSASAYVRAPSSARAASPAAEPVAAAPAPVAAAVPAAPEPAVPGPRDAVAEMAAARAADAEQQRLREEAAAAADAQAAAEAEAAAATAAAAGDAADAAAEPEPVAAETAPEPEASGADGIPAGEGKPDTDELAALSAAPSSTTAAAADSQPDLL